MFDQEVPVEFELRIIRLIGVLLNTLVYCALVSVIPTHTSRALRFDIILRLEDNTFIS